MIKITQALIDLLNIEIVKVSTKRFWSSYEFEIMDDSEFVLITIFIANDCSLDISKQICSEVKEVVEPLVPERQDDYSWMCIVLQNGDVVASSFGGWAD